MSSASVRIPLKVTVDQILRLEAEKAKTGNGFNAIIRHLISTHLPEAQT